MLLPSAIIFINPEMPSQELLHIKEQLYVDEIIQDTEFDARMVADPNYTAVIHGQNLRILVIRNNFSDHTNREYADLVLFVKQGLLSVEKNNFGPPGATFPIVRFNLWSLLRAANSNQVVILPDNKPMTTTECDCQRPFGLGGIVAIELRDTGITACKNPDNIYNNIDFINRK